MSLGRPIAVGCIGLGAVVLSGCGSFTDDLDMDSFALAPLFTSFDRNTPASGLEEALEPIGCVRTANCGKTVEEFARRVTSDLGGDPLVLLMGQQGELTTSAGRVTIRNLSSKDSEDCEIRARASSYWATFEVVVGQ